MTELGRARAVIAIWTDASIKSDWVRSEAGRAQADRKLLPVKLAHLTYKDLPPPFDVLHTENVSDDDKIRAAVIAQLAKPAVEPSAGALLTKKGKSEVLAWCGIVGGTLTLFTNLSAVLKLADWARLLVENWKAWTHAFWVWLFGWLGINLPPGWTLMLSFLMFWLLLVIGQVVKSWHSIENLLIWDTFKDKSITLISWRALLWLLSAPMLVWLWMWLLYEVLEIEGKWEGSNGSLGFALSFAPPLIISVVIFAKHRLHAVVVTSLAVAFCAIMVFNQADSTWWDSLEALMVSMILLFIQVLILLSAAPVKATGRRLIFLATGLILLIALSEFSKLVDVTAPKLHG
jgi:hypothetical protein